MNQNDSISFVDAFRLCPKEFHKEAFAIILLAFYLDCIHKYERCREIEILDLINSIKKADSITKSGSSEPEDGKFTWILWVGAGVHFYLDPPDKIRNLYWVYVALRDKEDAGEGLDLKSGLKNVIQYAPELEVEFFDDGLKSIAEGW